MIARLNKHWTIAIVLIVTVLLSAQLLRHSRNPDGALIPSEWQDWVASRWKGGDITATEDKSQDKDADDKKDQSTDNKTATNDAAVRQSTTATAQTSTTAEKKPSAKPSPKPKKPTPAKERPSPTAAHEILETQAPLPENFDATSQMFDLNGPPEHDPAGPRPDQIVVLTATDGNGHNDQVQDIIDMALHNRREYCEHHGYINHFTNLSRFDIPAHAVWKKLPAIIEAFQTYPDALWVWWLDLDAILMTLDYKMEERIFSDAAMAKILMKHEEFKLNSDQGMGVFTPKKPDIRKADMLIAQDHNTLNAGSFMLRRSEWTRMMLDVWRDPLFMNHGWPMQEQDALLHMVRTNPEIRSHVGIVGQRVLNEYLFTFNEGDLVVHFAGCWVQDQCQEHWDEMWKRRYGTLDFPPKAKGDKSTTSRMKKRRGVGDVSAMEQIARGWFG